METPKKNNDTSSNTNTRKRYREVPQQEDLYQNIEFDKNDIVILSPFYPSGIEGKGIQRGGESDQFVVSRHITIEEESLQVKDTHAVNKKNSKTYTVKRSQVIGHMKMETHLREKKSFNNPNDHDDRSSLEPPSISPSKTSNTSSSSSSRRDEKESDKTNQSEHKQHLLFMEDVDKDSTTMQSPNPRESSNTVFHHENTDEDDLSNDSDFEEDIYPFSIVSKKNSRIARSTLERQNLGL